MGNRIFSYSRYLFFILFFAYHTVAVSEDAQVSISDSTPATKNGQRIPCRIKFEDLSFVGVKFVGEATCVAAESDAEAVIKCGIGGRKGLVVNPGNPQYHETAKGDFDTNPEGYYYCPKVKTKRNKKQYICDNVAKNESEYRETKDINFKWYPYIGKKTDGTCVCGIGDNIIGFRDCAQDGPEAAAETPKEEKAPETKAQNSTGADPSLTSCVEDWKKAADACLATAKDAQKTCDPKSEEAAGAKNVDDAMGAVTNGYTNLKTGSGSQRECFKAGLVGSSVSGALTLHSDSCESKVDLCTSSCSEEELNKKQKTCSDILAKIIKDHENDPEVSAADGPVQVNSRYYGDGQSYVDEKFGEGEKICSTDAAKNKSILSSMLEEVGKALQNSLKCMCQLSSTTNVDCSKIVPPQDCLHNSTGVGCGAYGGISVCTPGNGYDAKLCNCQLNPKDVGCPGAGGNDLSNFAGPGIKNNGTDGIGDIASGIKPTGNIPDITIPVGDQSGSGTPWQLGPSSGSPGGPGGVGGSPGGGGPSGGGGDSSAKGDAGAPPEEKGIGGLFNQAKSFISSALGKKSPSNSNSKNGKNDKGFDPDKFKPARVPASKRGYGTKNQDIWKMSNSCMYAETCRGNMNNFLDNPLKHK